MKAIPASQFAVVYNRERDMIIATGTIERCREIALTMNHNYQSTAYVARAWKENA